MITDEEFEALKNRVVALEGQSASHSNDLSVLRHFQSDFDRYVDLKLGPAVEALRGEIEALRKEIRGLRNEVTDHLSMFNRYFEIRGDETLILHNEEVIAYRVSVGHLEAAELIKREDRDAITVRGPLRVVSESDTALLLNIDQTEWYLGARRYQREGGSEVHFLELGAVGGERPLTLSSDCDLQVEGSIGVHGSADVDGDMSVDGNLSVDGSVFVEGTVHDEQGH